MREWKEAVTSWCMFRDIDQNLGKRQLSLFCSMSVLTSSCLLSLSCISHRVISINSKEQMCSRQTPNSLFCLQLANGNYILRLFSHFAFRSKLPLLLIHGSDSWPGIACSLSLSRCVSKTTFKLVCHFDRTVYAFVPQFLQSVLNKKIPIQIPWLSCHHKFSGLPSFVVSFFELSASSLWKTRSKITAETNSITFILESKWRSGQQRKTQILLSMISLAIPSVLLAWHSLSRESFHFKRTGEWRTCALHCKSGKED